MKHFSHDVQEDNNLSARKGARYVWPGATLMIVFVIVALLSSCAPAPAVESPGGTTEPPPTEPPAEPIPCSGDGGKYTCHGLSDHIIELDNVPSGVAPYLLPIADEAALREAPKEEGLGCIFVVVGDLAFYDESATPIHTFETPVISTYTLTEEDKAACSEYIATLIAEGSVKAADIDFIPVYFSDGLWKDLSEDYEVAIDGSTITMTVTTWGDSPIGGGTKP